MKNILILTLLGWSAMGGRAADAPARSATGTNVVPLTPQFVNTLVEELRANHPALRALENRVRAASFNTNAVRLWDDPMFKFGGLTASQRGPSLGEDGDLVYGLEQKLPLFGKARAMRRVAEAEAGSETARLARQFEILRRDLTKALLRVALADRVVEIGERDLAWLDTMAAATEERYRAGAASQVELLRIQNERARRANQLRTEASRRGHERLSVNRFLNRGLHSPLPQLELPPPAGPVPYHQELVDRAAAFEPRLRVMRREIEQAEASVAVTRKSRLPDVIAGIEGRQYSGDGGFREGMFTVSLNLPWFNRGKYRSDLARDQARLKAVELDAADYQLSVREEVHHLTVGIDAARREALLYRDEVLPRSQQALESAHANWGANRGMFNDVMEARRMLLEAQLMHARAVAEQHQMLSDLALLCGASDAAELQAIVSPDVASPTPTPQP
jgi:outer membrane protein TolC